MANEKAPIKERIAAAKAAQEAVTAASKEARVRTICAWTIAKTMLPKAPAEVQQHLASALLGASTKVLKAALRQTAINAHWTKFAETYESVHKKDLNDLMVPASELSKERSAVSSEMKGDPKNAKAVKADDRKDAGPQPDKYDDGRHGSEPKDMDASVSEKRPADTVNKTEGGEKEENSVDNSARVTAAAKKAEENKEADAKCATCGKMGCSEHKAAASKKADEPAPPAAGDAAPPAEAAPAAEPPIEAPAAEEAAPAPEGEAAPEEAAAGMLTEDKKEQVAEQIAEAQNAIQNIEETILEEGEEELDLSKMFSEPEDRAESLANEGEEAPAEEAPMGEDFFGPSDEEEMVASMDQNSNELAGMFASAEDAANDSMAALFATTKEAAAVDGHDVVPSFTGEAANHFESEIKETETRDSEADHKDDLWAEIIEDQKPEESGQTFCEADKKPVMNAPKAAAKAAPAKKESIKKIKATAGTPATEGSLADLLFGPDEN